ncbi:MAG: transglycosylase domain-containing protein, partial [Phycisphaeraceae bacterium]|nr:transglycosylase domain-containing protein [Phycisphaeraceae bacterium]
YTKTEILEFYANQFYVYSNGRGIGIAAQYYFNKEVEDLDLAESAFIAGLVKVPAKYTPFIKRSKEDRDTAYRLAVERRNYVLKNMHTLKMIDDKTYEDTRNSPINFKRGSFKFKSNIILDQVKSLLESDRIKKTLQDHGIEDIIGSGIKVYTTLDPYLMDVSEYALKKHLSYLQMLLTGYANPPKNKISGSDVLEKYGFYIGQVRGVEIGKGKDVKVTVEFLQNTYQMDIGSFEALSAAELSGARGDFAQITDEYVKKFIKRHIKVDDYILVSVKDVKDDIPKLELENTPEVQGGVVVIQQSKILAAVSGFENNNFNRVFFAKRQPGSVFKPILYGAALELNWAVTDTLPNY